MLFWKPPLGFFIFFTLPLEIPDKTKLNPWIFHKIVLDPLEIPRPKTKTPLEIPHYFFLVTLGNLTSFLINPWKFHMLFLWYPWKFHILKLPPFWFRERPVCLLPHLSKVFGKQARKMDKSSRQKRISAIWIYQRPLVQSITIFWWQICMHMVSLSKNALNLMCSYFKNRK